jgi:TonB-linked SusC/RagA family outer membrane protein
MEKHNSLWVFSNRILRKPVMVSFLIAMIGFSYTYASPGNASMSALTENDYQQVNVTGKVTDATTGEALAGVNIVVEGTQKGAISDGSGAFTLTGIDRNATLTFTFIGYIKQSVPVGGKSVVNVALVTETKGLDEIVVIGYGSQKKETLTGAVSSVKSDQLLSTKSLSVAAAIQGKIPGVQIRQQTGEPGTFNSRISVRGFGEPLLVIDGIVRDGMSDFERLNPEDIESVSVLKDASASIYGLGAANGVFIVTTKKGFAGKTEFSLNTLYSFKQPTNDWSKINVDAYTMRFMWNEMARNSEKVPATSDTDLAKWKANDGTLYPGFTDFNWWKSLVRNHVNSGELTFNARGGNDVITFFTSFGFNNDGGYFKNNELEQYKKYTFRTNVEAKLAKGLKMNVSFYGRYENTMQPTRGTTWTFKRIITNDRGIGPYTLATADTIPSARHYTQVPSENTNVFGELSRDATGYNNTLGFQYQTTVDINYDIPFVKGLSIGASGAYDGQLTDQRTLNKNFMMYDYMTDKPKSSSIAPTTYYNQMTNFSRKDLQVKLNYRKSFSQHNIGATVVYEVKTNDNNYVNARRQYDDLYTTDIIAQGSLTNQSNGGNRSEGANLSYFGRFNYDFKNKYLVEVTLREDGTYRYAPNQRWGFFPAGSVGWRIGQEEFLKNALPMVSDMKLRASWGKSGRDAGNAFQYYEGYSFGGVSGGFIFNPGVLTQGMVPPGVVNSNLTWVSTTITDFGIDLTLWKGKLGIVFDWFKRMENGLLASRSTSLPNTFGASFPQENLNSQWETGYDMSISHRNTLGKFSYSLTGTLMYSRTYLKHIERSPNQSTWDVWNNGNDTYNDKGRIQGRAFGYKRDGIFTSVTQTETAVLSGGTYGNYFMLPGMDKIVDINGDGIISGSDQLPIMWSSQGTNPPLQFGLNGTASYRNFDLAINMAGSSLFNMGKSRGDQWGYGTQYQMFLAEYLNRWHTQNTTDNPFDPATTWIPGKWEALTQNSTGTTTGNQTNKWRMDATYLRIKTLELSYNVPVKYTKVVGLSAARIFFNGYNLFTFCKPFLKDMDPERDEGAYGAGNTYPIMRSYNIGLNIKF